jgi:hypothetical protein
MKQRRMLKSVFLLIAAITMSEDGKPFRTTARTRVNPILDSVRTGFHSMVEVFLSVGLKSQELSEMLSEAVRSHREDL